MLTIYNFVALIGFYFYLAYHRLFTKKYGDKVMEKFGFVPLRNSSAPCLLIHAVSVGEALAAKTIIDEFKAQFPDWDIFITVSTATARKVAAEKYGEKNVAYYPLDCSIWIERFLQCLRPQIVVLMELEIWPQFTNHCQLHRIPMMVANARITQKSAEKYLRLKKYLPSFVKQMFNAPFCWLAQTDEYAQRLREIGVEEGKIKIGGNVKFDQIPLTLPPEIFATAQSYRQLLNVGDGKLLVAGSTHPTEEETLLKAWKNLRADFPQLKLFIAPRHPHRVASVKTLAENFGKTILRSSLNENNNGEIIIGDTMGELDKFYAAADVVFVGGTLIAHGGQNMGEPCGLAKPTIIGNNYANFSETVTALQNANAIKIINHADELTFALREFLNNPITAQEYGNRARNALLQLAGASKKTANVARLIASAQA